MERRVVVADDEVVSLVVVEAVPVGLVLRVIPGVVTFWKFVTTDAVVVLTTDVEGTPSVNSYSHLLA